MDVTHVQIAVTYSAFKAAPVEVKQTGFKLPGEIGYILPVLGRTLPVKRFGKLERFVEKVVQVQPEPHLRTFEIVQGIVQFSHRATEKAGLFLVVAHLAAGRKAEQHRL